MAIKCRKCNRNIGKNDDYINCCKEHIACVNLNKAAWNSMKETGLLNSWGM